MTARPIVALDIESDGLHPGRHAWEVGMIRRDLRGEERTFHAFLPIDLRLANPEALDIGGFWQRHPTGIELSGQPTTPAKIAATRHVAQTVAQWTYGATIVGAVPNFDTECLAGLLRSQGFIPRWHHRIRCVETLTEGHLRREVGGLSDCCAALGIERAESDKHTALGDARDALRIWDFVMGTEATP